MHDPTTMSLVSSLTRSEASSVETPSAGTGRGSSSAARPELLLLRLLTDAASQRLGARCLDGSPGGYYFRRGVGSSASRFLLVLVGSGWCTSLDSCGRRAATAIGGSATWEREVHGYGMANASSLANPDFFDWSVAYAASCDGAFFLGDRPEAVAGLHFRGRAIVDAVIADLVRTEGLSSASALVVTGESSGGLAAALSVDRIAAQLPAVDVRAVADAAFFLDRAACGGDRISLQPIGELAMLNRSLRAAGCRDAELWKCASLPHALPSIQSPVFLTQAAYDYSQLGAEGEGLGCTPPSTTNASSLPACNATGMARFQAFADALTAQLVRATRNASAGKRGYVVIGCVAHGLTQYGRYLDGEQLSLWANADVEVPARSGRSVAVAVGDWYFNRSAQTAHLDAPWPHNAPCAWLGLPY